MKRAKSNNDISDIMKKSPKGEDEYIEVVNSTERIESSHRMLRIVSAIAASNVLITGIGATGYLLYKNKSQNSSLSEEEVVSLTQAAETTETSEAETDSNSVAPFADFRQIYFGIYELNNYDFTVYSDATYDKLAIFLNSFNWGEASKIAEKYIPDFDNYEGKGYDIGWQKGDIWFYVYVTEKGKAYYLEKKCNPDGNCFDYPIIASSVYNIDYATFDKGIQDIWSSDVPDTGDYLSKMDKMYLTQGEFLNGIVKRYKDFDSEEVVPENHKSFNALQGFLRDDFVGMLKKEKDIDYNSDELIYTVECYYTTSSTTTRRLTYYISGNGFANLCEYELTDTDEIPTGCSNYYIDIQEFETVLNDILSGKYDDKYSFEAKTTTTAVTTSSTTNETTTVPAAVQENVPEEEPKDEPVEKEPTDEDIFREYYISEHNGWNGSYDGKYEAIDENGNMVDFKDEINCLIYRADYWFKSDRVLGPIADEEDAIAKGRDILLRLNGQEYVDDHEKEYVVWSNGTKIIRDNPCYLADYNADYDIWDFRPTLFSGSSEDGQYHTATPGSVPHFYIRGCDGKILACFH